MHPCLNSNMKIFTLLYRIQFGVPVVFTSSDDFIYNIEIDAQQPGFLIIANKHQLYTTNEKEINRKVLAGTGGNGSADGVATSATFSFIRNFLQINRDEHHLIYIVDSPNNVIRLLNRTDARVQTVIGTADDGANFNYPFDIINVRHSLTKFFITDTKNKELKEYDSQRQNVTIRATFTALPYAMVWDDKVLIVTAEKTIYRVNFAATGDATFNDISSSGRNTDQIELLGENPDGIIALPKWRLFLISEAECDRILLYNPSKAEVNVLCISQLEADKGTGNSNCKLRYLRSMAFTNKSLYIAGGTRGRVLKLLGNYNFNFCF